jgi:hypothetical protein
MVGHTLPLLCTTYTESERSTEKEVCISPIQFIDKGSTFAQKAVAHLQVDS